MDTLLDTLAFELSEERKNEAYAGKNYAALFEAVFGEKFEDSFNDAAEVAEAVNKAMSTLGVRYRYCLEERYLHGRTLGQLTDKLRGALDMKEFTDKFIEDVSQTLNKLFMDTAETLFNEMRENSFYELNSDAPAKTAGSYGIDAYSTGVDILRDLVEDLNEFGFCYKDIFERYFLHGETKEQLAGWFSENLNEYVNFICASALRGLRNPGRIRFLKEIAEMKRRS